MVILEMSKPVPDGFECEVLDKPDIKERLSLVRPCERYKELYKSCTSLQSRIYQLYIWGETIDCGQHDENFKACMKYRRTKDVGDLDRIVKWEQQYKQTRLNTVTQNKAWDLRDSPPDDFEAPLPEFLAKKKAGWGQE